MRASHPLPSPPTAVAILAIAVKLIKGKGGACAVCRRLVLTRKTLGAAVNSPTSLPGRSSHPSRLQVDILCPTGLRLTVGSAVVPMVGNKFLQYYRLSQLWGSARGLPLGLPPKLPQALRGSSA